MCILQEKTNFLIYKIFAVLFFDEKWLIQRCRAATGRVIVTSDGPRRQSPGD